MLRLRASLAIAALMFAAFAVSSCQAQLVGAPVDVDLGDSEAEARVKSAAQFAVSEIQKRSNTLETMQMESVSNVRRQVVAGLNYFMDVIIRRGDIREMHHVVVYDHFGTMYLTKDDIDLDWIASHNPHSRR
mmetsp:Transcript_11385/g.36374  ORF Transcript_11385/g.36374 Transcript_11385/m.36374 type:complete len:132 (-) Transcript_11385:209-604(-)